MKRDLPAFCYLRKGKYIYFERAGTSQRMPDLSDPAFWTRYAELMHRKPLPATGRTFAALIGLYRQEELPKKATRTRQDYDRVLFYLHDKIGKMPVGKLTTQDVARARYEGDGGQRFRNYVVQVLKVLCQFGVERGWLVDNPAHGVKLVKIETKAPHIVWTDTAVAKWRAEAGTLPRLIFELGIGTVQRPGDLVKFRWGDYDGSALSLAQGKTGTKLVLPVTDSLKAVLDAERARLTPHPTRHILTLQDGSRMSYRRMAEIFMAERKRLGTEAHDMHAMRYRGVQELAWHGCSDAEIASYSGHASEAMVRKYAAEARQIMRARQAKEKRK